MTTAAGYLSDTPQHISVTNMGMAPQFWWGITPPDGDASPWASAPIGSQYLMRASATALAVLFFKAENNEDDDDWGSFSIGRTISGGPVGLLLALTQN